jgi:hypothetical protein
MYHYYNGYDSPDETGYYKGADGMRGLQRMEPMNQMWETAREGRETSPGDVERAPMRYMNEGLVKTVQDCEASCEHMATYILSLPDIRSRTMQALLLRDCADLCCLAAKVLARNSLYTAPIATLCAKICKACGIECGKFSDAMSQQCSKICMDTAGGCADAATE